MIRTWSKHLEPRRAAEHTKELALRVAAAKQGLRRSAASQAVSLFASVGEFDHALEAFTASAALLDLGNVKLDPRTARWQKNNLIARQLDWDDVRALVPRRVADGVDAVAWCKKLAAHVLMLDAGKRLDPDTVRDVLATCCVRIHTLGSTARAAALLDEIDRRSASFVRHELLVLDLARVFGREARAKEIETSLIERRCLPYGRVPEVVERLMKEKAESETLSALESFGERSLDSIVVDPLITLAERLGKQDRVEFWKQQRAEAKVATAELKLTW